MKTKIMSIVAAVSITSLTSCSTYFQAVNIDPRTGYLPTAQNQSAGVAKASVLLNQKVNFDLYGGRMLVSGGAFFQQEMSDIGAFSDVMTNEDLQKRIIAAGLQDKVPSVSDLIGLNKAYRYYKAFLWTHFEFKDNNGNHYVRMIVTDPGNAQDLFEASASLCGAPVCEDDQHIWYPLFNSFIDWVRANGGIIKTTTMAPPKAEQ
ncbi:MAG: hypothetical protein WCC11_01090 [Gammaproteobacteria bacterium]